MLLDAKGIVILIIKDIVDKLSLLHNNTLYWLWIANVSKLISRGKVKH